MEQPNSRNLYTQREREVSPETKVRLFALANDILTHGNTESRPMSDYGYELYDSDGEPLLYDTFSALNDGKPWLELQYVGVPDLNIQRWPERTIDGFVFPAQINIVGLSLRATHDTTEAYTMQANLKGEEERVQITNRKELQRMKLEWLEISSADARRIDTILTAAMKHVSRGLATP